MQWLMASLLKASRLENGMIRFAPPTRVSVGFEYYLRYTTDHRILDRTRLRGFDSVYLGPGSELRFTLANRYTDRRPEMEAILERSGREVTVFRTREEAAAFLSSLER